MADAAPNRGRRKRRTSIAFDEFGGSPDGALGIITPDGTVVHRTPVRVAAALRFLLARVDVNGAEGLPVRTALTSALLGEGVTYITRSLAAVLAYDTAASVAVVDMNWRRPTPSAAEAKPDAKGGEPSPPHAPVLGLSAVVDGEHALDDIIIATTNPRLSLVPAGELSVGRRPAVNGSSRLYEVIDELDSRFDFLLFDLPPLLASAEAITLSHLADAYILVVRQGVTASNQVEAALGELASVEALGVVLNKYETRVPRRLRRLVGT